MSTTFAILAGIVLLALFAPKRGTTTEVTSLRRGLRVKWRGTTGWPSDAPVPRFRAGQKVTIKDPDEPKDSPVNGKTVTITEMVYSEVVGVKADGSMVPLGMPGSWGYVVDLKIDGQEVRVSETSLVPEGAAVSGAEEMDYLCGDLPIDRILASGMVTTVELGYSWKKFGRALKRAAKWCWKNKYVKWAAVAAASTAMNIVAPGSGVALLAAVAIVDKATHKDKKIAAPALQKIQEIKDKADAGDPKAKEALSTLTLVREGQKEAAKEGPIAEAEPLPDLKAEEE
jgi:hypothetical protein